MTDARLGDEFRPAAPTSALAGVSADAGRLTMLTQRAQVDGLVCHGLRRGAHHGLVLVDEWLPPGRWLDREGALAEFAAAIAAQTGRGSPAR